MYDCRRRVIPLLLTSALVSPARGETPSEARRFASVLVPQLSIGAIVERLASVPPSFASLAYARLSWPLDAVRHEPAALRNDQRAVERRQSVTERMAELRRRRASLRAQARDAERQLQLDEVEAQLDAATDLMMEQP
jgi:hypothetical protein